MKLTNFAYEVAALTATYAACVATSKAANSLADVSRRVVCAFNEMADINDLCGTLLEVLPWSLDAKIKNRFSDLTQDAFNIRGNVLHGKKQGEDTSDYCFRVATAVVKSVALAALMDAIAYKCARNSCLVNAVVANLSQVVRTVTTRIA